MEKKKKIKRLYNCHCTSVGIYHSYFVSAESGCRAVQIMIRHLNEVEGIPLEDIKLPDDVVAVEVKDYLY